jgi:hypothetical protein
MYAQDRQLCCLLCKLLMTTATTADDCCRMDYVADCCSAASRIMYMPLTALLAQSIVSLLGGALAAASNAPACNGTIQAMCSLLTLCIRT